MVFMTEDDKTSSEKGMEWRGEEMEEDLAEKGNEIKS